MNDEGLRLSVYSQVIGGLLGVGLGVSCFTGGQGLVWLLVAAWAGAFTVQTHLRYLAPTTTVEHALGEAIMDTLAELPPGGSVTVTQTEIVPDYSTGYDDEEEP